MLTFFKRLEKTRNFLLLLFAIVMVGSLVFFYTPTRNTLTANLAQSDETAASVSGHTITVGEVVRQKENFAQMFGGRQSMPAESVLQGLIGSRLVRIEAARLGLTASDAEVAAAIREQNKSTDGRPFDQAIYERNVTESYGSISDYEQRVRDDLSGKKLEAFLTSGVTVSEQEVVEDYQKKNTKFDLSYVAVNSTELAKKIAPTDAELQEYFEKNKASYYISVPQKKVKYVFINTAKLGEKLSIPEADLRAEYDALPNDKKQAGVLGQEIVLRVPNPDQETQVQGKATELVQQLRAMGPNVAEQTFADMAKGHSENPATAGNGGKLPGPVRENPNKKDDPYQQLLSMQPGQVSEPITYQGRVFILRRGEAVPKSFEDAKKEIEVSLRNRRSYAAAADLAQKVAESLKETKDPVKTAQTFAAEANMSATDMVRETAYVKPGDDIPNVGISPQFEEGIAPLNDVGAVGEKTPIQGGFAIPMLVDKKEPRDAEFAEVRDQIVDVVKLEKARAQVEEIAKQIAAGAASVDALGGAATARGMAAKDQKNFIIGSPVGEGPTAGTNEALQDAIYALKVGDVTKTPIKVGDNWYVVGVTKREEANMADFATQRAGLMQTMLTQKRSAVFSDYLTALKRRMETEGAIKIYKDVLAQIDEPVPGLPGLPGSEPIE